LYLLLEANIVLGYYLPQSLDFVKARERIQTIIDSVRTKQSSHFLDAPNFCIAEIFSNLAKYSFGRYNRHVVKNSGTIDTRIYQSLCEQFQKDIHNARLLYQLELNRDHVLAVDLVASIDHYFKIRRTQKYATPSGTFEQLIVAMSIHLAHVHGQSNIEILTADSRLTALVTKCRTPIPARTVQNLKLARAQNVAGKAYGPDIFPEAIHLGKCSEVTLERALGAWPLPIGRVRDVYRYDG
jgi:hypothetical protein